MVSATDRFLVQKSLPCVCVGVSLSVISCNSILYIYSEYRGADKSLALPGRKQAAPVKSVMGRGVD